MVPSKYIFDGYNPLILKQLQDDQRALIEFLHMNPDVELDPRILVILEDVIDQDLHHDPVLKTVRYLLFVFYSLHSHISYRSFSMADI